MIIVEVAKKKCSGFNGNYVQMIYECDVIIFMFLRILANSEVIWRFYCEFIKFNDMR